MTDPVVVRLFPSKLSSCPTIFFYDTLFIKNDRPTTLINGHASNEKMIPGYKLCGHKRDRISSSNVSFFLPSGQFEVQVC